MAIELNNRTKILAGVVVLAAAGAGAWFFLFEDDAPPPRTVAAPPAARKADAEKSAEAAKGAAPAATGAAPAKPAAKPIPTNPDQLIAEVLAASGLRAQMQLFSRETVLRADEGDVGSAVGPADARAVSEVVDRAFEPAKLNAEIAESLKRNLDAERMARFLELLRQPVAQKMAGLEARPVPPEAAKEFSDNFRKAPPPAARVKLIQEIDDATHASEVASDLANALARDMVEGMLDGLQKAGKNVSKQARQMVGSQLNAMRGQARGQFRTLQYIAYRDASDEDLAAYLKLLDTDTGRWGAQLLAEAYKPIVVARGRAIGRELAPVALARRTSVVAKAPVELAPEPLATAQTEASGDKPAASTPAAAPPPPTYQRPANIRDLYTRYNDLITATVMRDRAGVKELLDDGKLPNVRQSDGTTPLMIAAANGDTEIAGLLLAKGADPNLRSTGGFTALSVARARGAAGAAMVQLLQRGGAKD